MGMNFCNKFGKPSLSVESAEARCYGSSPCHVAEVVAPEHKLVGRATRTWHPKLVCPNNSNKFSSCAENGAVSICPHRVLNGL